MMYGQLPVTLPINATDDRVIGGWDINELLGGKGVPLPGLLEEANGSMLYVDEINLLDDHIVNIILDATSTGILVVQREGRRDERPVSFTLVGTMNPEEGGLRPQLLDRFGLMVTVEAESDAAKRAEILSTVLEFDRAEQLVNAGQESTFLDDGDAKDSAYCTRLKAARDHVHAIILSPTVAAQCVALAQALQAEGHRGDYVLALGAQAYAALKGDHEVTVDHLQAVAPLAFQHRRPVGLQGSGQVPWSAEDNERVVEVLHHA
jgi:magnesium chelatase subunit I